MRYLDDVEADGIADYSAVLEALEIAELSEALAFPLLAVGVAGSGRVLLSAYRSVAHRRPPSRHYIRHF